jgi:hypothetical protein
LEAPARLAELVALAEAEGLPRSDLEDESHTALVDEDAVTHAEAPALPYFASYASAMRRSLASSVTSLLKRVSSSGAGSV